ncbi:MAG: hypothetical protein AAEJ52_21240 [Myxococcota bacterium]
MFFEPSRRNGSEPIGVSLKAVGFALSLALGLSASASADGYSDKDAKEFVVSVFHGPAVTVLANPDSNGHQLGDLRVVSLPTEFASGERAGRLDATLITTGIDAPGPNDEIRISNLIFVFGLGLDQIVVNGSGFYPAAGPTIDFDTTLIRPVTGGSGAFAGTGGWAETRHFPDDTWEHTFHLLIPEEEDHRGHHRRGRGKRH